MKALLSILMIPVFLFNLMGFQLSSHFCADKLMDQSVQIGQRNTNCCKPKVDKYAGHTKIKRNCCKNTHLDLSNDWSGAQMDIDIDFGASFQLVALSPQLEPIQASCYKAVVLWENVFPPNGPPQVVKDTQHQLSFLQVYRS